MLIKEALNLGFKRLKEKNINSFILDSELILGFVLKKRKEWILSNPNFVLHYNAKKRFIKLINKRAKNYPIAYILGYKYFCGLKFKVNKNVLIPRPETEIMVDEVLKSTQWVEHPLGGLTILDIGCGSGCIAISLGVKLENSQIIASDISKLALNIAQKNARLNNVFPRDGMNKNIKFIKSNLLENIKNEKTDIIVANLPYVPTTWKHDSIKYEPRLALYSSRDGLGHYKKLLYQIKNLNFLTKYIFLEIDPSQVEILKKLTNELFPKSEIQIKKDLQNLDRVFIVKLK